MIRLTRQVVHVTGWLVLLLGTPTVLITAIVLAAPVETWAGLLDQPPLAWMIDIVDTIGWAFWGGLTLRPVLNVLHNARGALRPARLPMSLHSTLTAVTGMAAVSAASLWQHPGTATASTPPAPAAPTTATAAGAQPDQSIVDSHRIILTATVTSDAPAPAVAAPVYRVQHGDWLAGIADRYLGHANRYPDIARLNPHLITDPDHIEPGWHLILPADAVDHGPHRHATGTLLTPTPPTDPAAGATTPHTGTPHEPTATPGADSPAGGPAPVQTPSPRTEPAPSTAADAATSVAPPAGSTPTGHRPATDTTSTVDNGHDTAPHHHAGVAVPGGWISLPFAAALLAAAGMVWRRRRHRYTPDPLQPGDDDGPPPLPPVVPRLRRAVREQAPDLLHPVTPPTIAAARAADAAPQPDLPPVGPSGVDLAGLNGRVPAVGLGLLGPGAEAAARALLIATLSTGSPADPDAEGHVIITADTMTRLLGADPARYADIPRLDITADLPEALTHVEELLIARRRLLDEHDATDVAAMRATDPYHPPMPPVLLLLDTPPADQAGRLTTVLRLGSPLQITAVLLGDWPHGDTLSVRADGHTDEPPPARVGVLDIPTTVHLLDMLREAHTGQPDPPAGAAPPTPLQSAGAASEISAEPAAAAALPQHGQRGHPAAAAEPSSTPVTRPADDAASATSTATTAPPSDPTPDPAQPRPVRITLLGEPTILDHDGKPVHGLRQHARELLVYLAVHRGGADLSQIMEAFWPTATVRRASERLSTEAGNLRGRIRHAAGDKDIQPIPNTGSRYHLNPDVIDLDLWHLLDTLRHAAATKDPTARIGLLRHAVDTHTGTLAEGCDYDWLDQPREHLRRHAIRARLDLAALLTDTEPHTAADLTRAAAHLDPLNEDVARHAMHAAARIGDTTAVREILQQLRTALHDIDEEPSDDTVALAAQLHREHASTGVINQP